jgi:hypothetical protein
MSCRCILYWETISLSAVITHLYVRIGNALNDSSYLNVSGYNLLRTSVTDDGTFEGVAFTVGETTEHILLSLGHDFEGSY